MTLFKRLSGAAAAAALFATPTLAVAAPKAPVARATAPAARSSHIAEGPTATFVSIGILAALVAIVLVATGGSDDDSPDSN